MNRSRAVLLALLALLTAFLAFSRPAACSSAAVEALTLCGHSLLPALFPFLIVSSLMVDTGAAAVLGLLLRPAAWLLGLPAESGGVLLIGLTGGFAPAASAAAGLYRQGRLSAGQTARLLPACICSGPSFVILAVGTAMLGNEVLGVLLFCSQAGACFLCGLLTRLLPAKRKAAAAAAQPTAPMPSLYRSVSEATLTFVRLCGFVVYFRFLAGGLSAFLPQRYHALPVLLCEVSSGCAAAAQMGTNAAYWCCAVLSLQSFSVLMQVRALVPAEVSFGPLLGARLVHLPLSLLLLRGMLHFCPAQQAYSSLAPRVVILSRCGPLPEILLFCACCLAVCELNRTLHPAQNPL